MRAPLKGLLSAIGQNYVDFLINYPKLFVIAPIIVTVVLSTGISKFHIIRGVHFLYSPSDAPWIDEEMAVKSLWAQNDDKFYPGKDVLLRNGIFFIIKARDDGNVLSAENSLEMISIIDAVKNFTFLTKNGDEYQYQNVCLHFQNQCFSNTHIRILAQIFAESDEAREHTHLNVTYPLFSSKFLTEPIDLSSVLGGVKVQNGHVSEAKVWILAYQLRQKTEELKRFSSEFIHQLPQKIDQLNLTHLNVYHFHSETFDDELAQNALRMLPKFSITFTILIVFSVICTFTLFETPDGLYLDWIRSKPLMGIIGVLSTLMAITSAIGVLLWFDVTFVEMCSVMPFLSLTIGIDDSFLLLSSWHSTNPADNVKTRLSQCLGHAASSITITSITDTLAFLIGSIAPLPAVKYFCYYSCVAIIFIYLYTMTLFSASLAILGGWEREKRNSVFYVKTKEYSKKLSLFDRTFNTGNGEIPQKHKKVWYQIMFGEKFGSVLTKPWIQILVLISYIVYITLTAIGLESLKIGFNVTNIVSENESATKFLELRQKYFETDASEFDLLVMNPPNLGNHTQRRHFLNILEEFESNKCARNRSHTSFWLFEYQKYLENLGFESFDDIDLDKETFDQDITPFLMSSDKFSYDYIPNKAFRLTIQMNPFENETQISECAKIIRDVCNRHPEYKLTSFTPIWNLADQLDTMWTQTMQDLYISVGVMVAISLLFMPEVKCGLVIGTSILSVGFGVLGFIDFWDVKLDATSMITIAMSVGFSVDFAAHVVYAFNEQGGQVSPDNRLKTALGTVGWPISQGTTSVFFGVIVLGTINSYIVRTCFKTIFLVISFGITHALIYIPVLLNVINKLEAFLFNKK
ncbi:unnamed protein product [Bursaphelenchus xylophilus]|uniref:(pine wood nematode) hypothetical protein n=1 Tax=Bursaphelenchus xylophilus TaxID=6326 RepID=A0A1I7RNV8_BURXY|nr:unnamed protein product [Bursaphelenchus xylophilus]CAG9124330.1 unnamed protein product [Bursaphelenchus xylophilus]